MRFTGLLLADFDETLERVREPLTAGHAAAIRRLTDHGILVAIVSGSSAAGLRRRICERFPTESASAIRIYANYGGCCFDGNGSTEYDRSPEFAPFRAQVTGIVGDIGVIPRVEQRETQVTLDLKGVERLRPRVVAELRRRLPGVLQARPAGTKSIDITLATITKRTAVEHLLAAFPELVRLPRRRVVIAGDSFGPGGADTDLLHEDLADATVFCAGQSVPSAQGFAIVRATTPGPDATHAFLDGHFGRVEGWHSPARQEYASSNS